MKKQFDTFLFLPAFVLIAIGVVMIFSASCPTAALEKSCNNDPFFFLKRQLAWVGIGLVMMTIAYQVDLRKLRKFSLLIILAAIGMLVLVLVPAFSREILGARRSLVLGPLTFQPSEFAKLALVFYLADAFARRRNKMGRFASLLAPLGIFILMALLIEKQPDLGSTIVIGGTVLGMLFLGGANVWHLTAMTSTGIALAAARIMMESYRIKRIMAFINPWHDPQGAGYQIIQSFIALGSGGLYGLGIGESRQKFFYLPEKFTDFIFAIIGEELGLLYGTIPVVILFLVFLYKGLRVATNNKDPFMSLLAGGITFQIVLQAFINMGVVTGLLPCTGIPLPFVSFGGSSLVLTLLSLGLLLNVASCPNPCNARERKKNVRARPRFTSSGSISGHLPTVNEVAIARRVKEESEEENEQNKNGDEKCGSSLPEVEPGATFTPL